MRRLLGGGAHDAIWKTRREMIWTSGLINQTKEQLSHALVLGLEVIQDTEIPVPATAGPPFRDWGDQA